MRIGFPTIKTVCCITSVYLKLRLNNVIYTIYFSEHFKNGKCYKIIKDDPPIFIYFTAYATFEHEIHFYFDLRVAVSESNHIFNVWKLVSPSKNLLNYNF